MALGLGWAAGVSCVGFVLLHDDRATAYLALPVVFLLALRRTNLGSFECDLRTDQGNRSEERFRALFQAAPYALVVFDADGRIELANSQSERIFGYAREELIGQAVEGLVPSVADRPPASEAEATHPPTHLDLRARRRDGHEFPVEVSLTPLSTERGSLISAAIRDVTEVREAAEALAHRASHDALTGLPNRGLFVDRLEQALHRARRSARTLAVVFVDLDDFKVVNDTHGHTVGDLLLVGLTPRLTAAVRPGDTVARFGGDEFVVLCEDLDDEVDATSIAQRIADAAGMPMSIGGQEIGVSISAGLVVVTAPDQASVAEVLRDADAAMYRSKRAGKGQVVIFDAGMRARLVERVALQSALTRACERGELRLLYQPVFALDQRRMVAVEALLRWQHPEHGLLEPADFIQVAESSGLIGEIGEWAIEEACRQAAAWRDAVTDRDPIHVSVNLSPWQVARSDIAATVARILESTGLEPELLALEVAERTLLQDEESASRVLRDLKAIGVSLVLDDFGTGYHSISNLKRLTIDGLKLDRSFVGGIGDSSEDGAIISAVLSMASALEVGVTAEGVETPEQLSRLRSHGCEFAQGFLLARPASADEVEALLGDEMADRPFGSRRARGSGASGREAGVQQLHRLIGRIARVQ